MSKIGKNGVVKRLIDPQLKVIERESVTLTKCELIGKHQLVLMKIQKI